MSFQELLKKLEKGELPEELYYCPKENVDIDWTRVAYNTYYKSDDYILERFPNSMSFQNLPGSEKIIETIRESLSTPLEEIEERQNIIAENSIDEDDEIQEGHTEAEYRQRRHSTD